jgi:N-acetylmuramoyl-L-alanine amidase
MTELLSWRRLLPATAAMAVLLLGGCAAFDPRLTTTPGGVPIDIRHNAKGQDSRVLFLVLHYTVVDLPMSIKILTEQEVSAHYLLSDESPPRTFRLVDESRRAWHSGPSVWKGHRMLNASSIGIEIVHPGYRVGANKERVFQPFAKEQIDALIPLVKDIVARHQIRPDRILGHGEVSPQFKVDPGPTFPWARLAAEGIVPPPPDASRVAARRAEYEASGVPDIAWFQKALAEHGYAIEPSGKLDEQSKNVITNFQMRYRPVDHAGVPDAECAAILWVLNNPIADKAQP